MNSPRQRSKLVIGVCALDNKARSKPMRNILDRLISLHDFDIVIFGDKVIFDEPIENWPGCDFLISFFSRGFPLEKAIQYAELRKPFSVNDLPLQQLLLDRRLVLMTLDAIDVATPKRLTVTRDNGPTLSKDVQLRISRDFGMDLSVNLSLEKDVSMITPDIIKVGNRFMRKPFVEKPVNGENHNIYIYYPAGGIRKLFRKVANKSSEYVPEESQIRTDQSYIYEEFMSAENSEDVKVYTIGPYYTYAETRKSPVVDGIVKRNAEGKEVRYVTTLTEEELEIARRVCMAFGQTICGFDLLRANGKSYVIDVNGWSFVKGNGYYYDLCARILRETFLRVIRKRKTSLLIEPILENHWRLKRYISILRHADRTPKQKLKFHLKNTTPFLPLIPDGVEVIMRHPEKLQNILELTKSLTQTDSVDKVKLEQLKEILEKKIRHADTKLQFKPVYSKESPNFITKIIVVVKWGGEFTHSGRHQSKDLAENLRQDLLLLNRLLLDDIKIYSSSERRVIATSEVFAKAFIPLAELPVGFIKINKEMLDDNTLAKEEMDTVKLRLQEILRSECCPSDFENYAFAEELYEPRKHICKLIEILQYHRDIMKKNNESLSHISQHPTSIHDIERDISRDHKWCCFDSARLWQERWEKIFYDICGDKGAGLDALIAKLEPSKFSELHDSLKYDAIHNQDYLQFKFIDPNDIENSRNSLHELHRLSNLFFDFISLQEYGITPDEKLNIGHAINKSLFDHIKKDLYESKNSSNPSCSRFYFTKESHVYPLLNVVLNCGLTNTKLSDINIRELDYLSQITFEVYERKSQFDQGGIDGHGMEETGSYTTDNNGTEYSLRISLSPGAHVPTILDIQLDHQHAISVAPRQWITDHIELDNAIRLLSMGKSDQLLTG